jgi:hypothetical protein
MKFALFLKVLIRYLEKTDQTSILRQVRLVVLACIRGHRMGDPTFMPLEESIEIRLKKLVNSSTWEQAKRYTIYYMRRSQTRVASRSVQTHPFDQLSASIASGCHGQSIQAKRIEKV